MLNFKEYNLFEDLNNSNANISFAQYFHFDLHKEDNEQNFL